jgi:hypothetical protein
MRLNVTYNYKWMPMQLVFKFGWIWFSFQLTLRQNVENIVTCMTIFVVVKGIYNYYDYSVYGFVAKAINHIFGHSRKCHSHQL